MEKTFKQTNPNFPDGKDSRAIETEEPKSAGLFAYL